MKRISSADKLLNYRYEENKLHLNAPLAASLAATILNAALRRVCSYEDVTISGKGLQR